MSAQIVPLTSDSDQQFSVALSINGGTIYLALEIMWNEISEYWVMTIWNAVTGILILDSIPLITGQYPAGNIFGQYDYLNIGSAYVINASNINMDYPEQENLGTDFVLYWTDN